MGTGFLLELWIFRVKSFTQCEILQPLAGCNSTIELFTFSYAIMYHIS